jgi:hypothetical protein
MGVPKTGMVSAMEATMSVTTMAVCKVGRGPLESCRWRCFWFAGDLLVAMGEPWRDIFLTRDAAELIVEGMGVRLSDLRSLCQVRSEERA